MLKQTIAIFLSACLAWSGMAPHAQARVVANPDVAQLDSRAQRLDAVQAQLAREDVRAALERLGVDPLAAQSRVAVLDEAELALLEGQLEELPAGGSVLALVGAVFVVLLILELTGVIDIFKRT